MTTKARATMNEGQPRDVLAAGDALQARRAAEALAQVRARVADAMAEFERLEPEYERVKPLAADFERWKEKYRRDWVRAEPGINFTQLDAELGGVVQITQFPGVVEKARALYATMTVEGSAHAERTIRTLLRAAEGIQSVEGAHRDLKWFVEDIDKTIARRIANATLQPPPVRGLAPATSGAGPHGPRHARSAIGSGDQE